MASFVDMGFPTTTDEDWRYTNVDPIKRVRFQVAGHPLKTPATEALPRLTREKEAWPRLVFLNSYASAPLSSLKSLPVGVRVCSLSTALRGYASELEPHLAQHARYQDQAFVALNTAFFEDGAFVCIPPDTVLKEPLQLLYLCAVDGKPMMSHPRNLIIVGAGSRATIVERYMGLNPGLYFTNGVTEFALGEHAEIEHYLVQQESQEAFHISSLDVYQDSRSRFSSFTLALGGAIARNEVHSMLGAEDGVCSLAGLYAGAGQQHIDILTRIEHAKPRCASSQFYKGIFDGNARGVFMGGIRVQQDAQETDARQTNKNLLLSEGAAIYTKPQLEILADDVTCTHGATVGQLDEAAVFYLRSRGLSMEAARGLMVSAFADEVISQIKLGALRDYFSETLSQWLLKSTKARRETNA